MHPFSLFPPCGTMFPRNSFFAGHVVERGALSEAYHRVHVNLMDIGPLDHQFNRRFNRNLSDIRRSTFNRAIVRSWGDTWTHLDATMKIGRRNWRDREIMAHDCHAIVAHDHRAIVAINQPSPNSPYFSRGNHYKYHVLLMYPNLLIQS